MSAESPHYAGQELDVFAHAARWKRYWSSLLTPLLAGDVLEVGAGIGATTLALAGARARSWTCLEPDARLARRLRETLDRALPGDDRYRVQVGGLDAVAPTSRFDTILYIDVLEHILDDRREAERAAGHLHPGGRLVVLAPAHQFLFSAFDRAIGHHRRYSRKTLAACTPDGCVLERLIYLDGMGLLASLANRLLLRQATPALGQVRFWDRVLVPVSARIDPLLGHRVGKSILGVWRKHPA
jgi:SAM-dependent methyltransferase